MRKNYSKMIKILLLAALVVLLITIVKLRLLNLALTREEGPFKQLANSFTDIASRDYFPGQEYVVTFYGLFSFLGIFAAIAIYVLYLFAGVMGITLLISEIILILIASALTTGKNKAKWKDVVADILLIFVSIAHFFAIYMYCSIITSFVPEIALFTAVYIKCLILYIKGKKADKVELAKETEANVIEGKVKEISSESEK